MKKIIVLSFLFVALVAIPGGAVAADNLTSKKEMIAQAGKGKLVSQVSDLITILKSDPDGFTRGYAAWALGEIGDPRAEGALREALKDIDKGVRTEAKKAIGKLH